MKKELIFQKLETLARAYGLRQLSMESGVSRQGIYRIFTERNPQFDTFANLAAALHIKIELHGGVPDAAEVYSSLRFYGAPISTRLSIHPLPIEEAIAGGVILSRDDGFLSSIVPYVMSVKADEINLARLIVLCDALGEGRALGYFADIANAFSPNIRMKLLSEVLFDQGFNEEDFFRDKKLQKPSYKKLAGLIDNFIAKKWKFHLIDSLDDQLERCQKWQRLE